ncbi:unnamed protein product [Arabis nemorensis]|uniref:Uncharacterized protein n=1 Tax=Arabis nemorensis TaxID=586526 RepID=A0A565BK67_9BRAS|nr:unnamed protein product [Arabis nemorensis]
MLLELSSSSIGSYSIWLANKEEDVFSVLVSATYEYNWDPVVFDVLLVNQDEVNFALDGLRERKTGDLHISTPASPFESLGQLQNSSSDRKKHGFGFEGIAALNLYVRDNEYVCAAPGGARGVKSITHYAPVNSVRLSYNIGDKRYFALKVLAILYSKISSSGYSKIAINPYTFASSKCLLCLCFNIIRKTLAM